MSTAPEKKPGCLRRPLGCFSTSVAVLVLGILMTAVLPGHEARQIQASIEPGMSVEQVFERAGTWLSCRAYAGPRERRIVDFEVWPRGYRVPLAQTRYEFANRTEMARALRADMKQRNVDWKITFGYLTMAPTRMYFDVELTSDGRVTRVTQTRWGVLN